jgi:hypothetical protein
MKEEKGHYMNNEEHRKRCICNWIRACNKYGIPRHRILMMIDGFKSGTAEILNEDAADKKDILEWHFFVQRLIGDIPTKGIYSEIHHTPDPKNETSRQLIIEVLAQEIEASDESSC